MLSWLAPILVFGLVVLVHELGHFLAAKWLGVYAPRFSIGFGPALWRRRFGETEYVLAALPLGGFVRMASREDEATAFLEGGSEQQKVPAVGASSSPTITGEQHAVEAKPKDWDPNAMIPFGPKPVPENRWFESKPLWGRLIIMLAGVTMTGFFSALIMFLQYQADFTDTFRMVRWLMGMLDVGSYAPLVAAAPLLLVACGLFATLPRSLDLISLGADAASMPCNATVLSAGKKHFDFACASLGVGTYDVTATGKASDGMGAFTYTINQSNVRGSTISGLSGWSGSTTCWVTKKGGVC